MTKTYANRRRGRSSGGRVERPVAHLFVEGASEAVYFDGFKKINRGMRLKIRDMGKHSPNVIIRKCAEALNRGEIDLKKGDIAAIVIDVDSQEHDEVMRYERECTKRGARLYISNPSFEVWLLMHFADVRICYTQEELESELSAHLGRPYSKSKGIGVTIAGVENSVRRAMAILSDEEGRNPDCLLKCPSTTIHFLIGALGKTPQS